MSNTPELLSPVGNVESFHAAIAAGADAIYLGLRQFNARGRAANFTGHQLQLISKITQQSNVRLYITLNTVVKSSELDQLIDYLWFLEKTGIDGIIIQDWGVYYLAKKYFPGLKIHASTQLGIHNSAGTGHAQRMGFKRVVLARELTLGEIEIICRKSGIETEVFIHGALCYSFSGMCLYSSYSGGWGANRGLCAQPCRRSYSVHKKTQFLFNLKDNEQLEAIPVLARIGVSSLKIEGRMKSGEYTYRVTKGYRLAIDEPEHLNAAGDILKMDFAREKTGYFLGGNVSGAISDSTVTGLFLGRIERVEGSDFIISSKIEIREGYRLRIVKRKSNTQENIKVKQVFVENGQYRIGRKGLQVEQGDLVYMSGMNDVRYSSQLPGLKVKKIFPVKPGFRKKVLGELSKPVRSERTEVFFRISSLDWLRKVHLDEVDGLFLNFSKTLWIRFDPEMKFIQKNRKKIFVELPKFIPEEAIEFYSGLIIRMIRSGIQNFLISHLSQIELIPKGCRIFTNENVYVFNNAACELLKTEKIRNFLYPQEIDATTLYSFSDKSGIVPVYFYPELFHSRMPVGIEHNNEFFYDDNKVKLRRFRRNGITSVVPAVPVSFFQFKDRLMQNGFRRFLIDVSYDSPSKNRIRTLKNRLLRSEQIQPSSTFNFSRELK